MIHFPCFQLSFRIRNFEYAGIKIWLQVAKFSYQFSLHPVNSCDTLIHSILYMKDCLSNLELEILLNLSSLFTENKMTSGRL